MKQILNKKLKIKLYLINTILLFNCLIIIKIILIFFLIKWIALSILLLTKDILLAGISSIRLSSFKNISINKLLI
jgi:hypothetical protein